MNALSIRPSTDEDAQALIGILNEERRLSAAELMPRIGILVDQVGPVCALVKFLHIAARARHSLRAMGFDLCSTGGSPEALYWIGRHDRSS